MRPVDGGQDISLLSNVWVSGLEGGDLDGLIRYDAKLKFVLDIPDILPHNLSLTGLEVNGKKIPMQYITKEGCDCRVEGAPPELDIARLVEDKLISDDDLDAGLEFRLTSKIAIDKVPLIDRDDVAGTAAYGKVADKVKKYTSSTKKFPAAHKRIRKLVDDYGKKHDNVLDIMRYALKKTVDSLRYHPEELNLDPVQAMADGRGDCDDYAGLYVTILRGFGIPAKYIEGDTADSAGGRMDGRHAWVEVLVPFKDDTYRWVLVEPTWADSYLNPDGHINFVDRQYLYKAGFSAVFDTDKKSEVNILQEHEWVSQKRVSDRKKVSEDGDKR
jgi:hypothetical protein